MKLEKQGNRAALAGQSSTKNFYEYWFWFKPT
jgi:hypothetical protein